MLLDFITTYVKEHGYPPCQREMANAINLSLSATNKRLWKLIREGKIEHEKRVVRGYRVL